VFGSNPQQETRRPSCFAFALLLVSQGSNAYTKQAGKLRLRELETGTDRRYPLWIDTVHFRHPALVATQVRAGFTDALDEFSEFRVFHENSAFTI
jgi:hypothetical protein